MKRFLALIIMLSLLPAAGCGGNKVGEETTTEEGAKGEAASMTEHKPAMLDGGTVKVTVRKPDTFNPLVTEYESCRELFYLFYDGLYTLTNELSATENLAESYTSYDDGTGGILKLKNGISFSDGSPLTVRDVIYTVEFIKEHPALYGGCVENIESITDGGGNTAYIKLCEPERYFEAMLTFPIIKADSPEEMSSPIGTGQFYCFEEDIGYTGLKCRRNNNYHMGRAYIESFEVSYTNTDLKAAAAFSSGETDLIVGTASGGNSGDKVQLYEGNSNRFEFLGLNVATELFSQVEARRALYEAIGKMKLSEATEKAECTSLTPINPNAWFASEKSQKEGDDPRSILERNSWVMGSAGIYEKNGISFSFKILVNEDASDRIAIARYISGALIKYGISADVTVLPYEEYAEKIASGEYDAFVGGCAIGNAANIGFLFKTGKESNVFGYSGGVMDLRLDALALAGEDELKSEEKKFNKVFAEAAPAVGLYFKNIYVTAKKDICIPSLSPTGVYITAYTWYLTK